MKEDVLLTIFTPTYNRSELLERVFRSLCAQTCRDFCWLIVDDGSTDDTGARVERMRRSAPFPLRYHYRKNGGKMRAHNTGVRLCETELFVCLDSDDIFMPDAVELICKKWHEHMDTHFCVKDASQRAGIVAYKGQTELEPDAFTDPESAMSGKTGLHNFKDSSFPEQALKLGYSTLRGLYCRGFKGETTLVFRTTLLRKYPFPEIKGEKYVPEDYVYDKIDGECPLLVLDEILTVCELMEGGYTDQAARLRRENPTGWLLYYEQRSRIQGVSLLKLKYMSHYLRFCSVTGKKCSLSVPQYILALPGALLLRLLGRT